MPKDNIERAINKSEVNKNLNYNSFIYEGFGPEKIAIIIEALTDNKNRTVSNIRTIFQKFGGNLGEAGVASHQFKQVGIINIDNGTGHFQGSKENLFPKAFYRVKLRE